MKNRIVALLAAVLAVASVPACASSPAGDDAPAQPHVPGAPSASAPGSASAAPPLVAPAFDPLLRCASLAPDAASLATLGSGSVAGAAGALVLRADGNRGAAFLAKRAPFAGLAAPKAPFDADVVATARVRLDDAAAAHGAVALLVRAGDDGAALGLRAGANGPELVRRDAAGTTTVLNTGTGEHALAGEWMLRVEAKEDTSAAEVVLSGKAWPAATTEPSAWQVRWRGVGPRSLGKIGLALTAEGSATLAYLLAAHASPEGVDAKDLSRFVSCSQSFPSVAAPPDGAVDPKGDAADQADARALLRWAIPAGPPRLVALSAGTNNDLDAGGAVTACASSSSSPWMAAAQGRTSGPRQARCITSPYEAIEIAYASLRVAGWSDADLADASRVQIVLWGYGDTTHDALLWYHPRGGAPDYAFPILGLGGKNAAINGPDGAPADGFVPFANTFAYTYQHARGDAAAFRDALNALAARGTFPTPAGHDVKLASDHTFVVSHSWGAAYTTTMMLREYPQALPAFHVDLALTAALPKVAVDLGALASCAGQIFGGDLGACLGNAAPKLDLDRGLFVGPGAAPLYRVDRPDDPVANAKDPGSLLTALKDVLGMGVLSGHEYIVSRSASDATAECTRSGGEKVRYLTEGGAAYLGIYGVDTFHVSCSLDGRVLEYTCDGVGKVASAFCKDTPNNGEKICASKPSDCN